MADIFLSYARKDSDIAKIVVEAFEVKGWSVFWDTEIPAGTTFDEYIYKHVYSAGCVVVLWSPNSVSSNWVRAETEAGLKRGVLIPAIIEEVSVPLGFGNIQSVGLTERNRSKGLSSMTGAVAALLGVTP